MQSDPALGGVRGDHEPGEEFRLELRRKTHAATDVFLHSTLYGTGTWDCGRSSGTGSDAGLAEEASGRQGVGVGEGEKDAVEDCEEGDVGGQNHRGGRAMAMDAAAAARREVIKVGGGVEAEAPGHVELVLVESPWFDPGSPVSNNNMRGFIGKVSKVGIATVTVQLWRSYTGIDKEVRVYAPAWKQKGGRELFSERRERGFSSPVVCPFERRELVGDVRGVIVKGGVSIAHESRAWRYSRGME